MAQKIIPHLWYDREAKEAAEFYTSTFPHSKIINSTVLENTPSGKCDLVSFDILGYSFMAISAGPLFKFTPAISFMVNFDPSKDKNAKEQLDTIWEKLIEGGKTLMPLDKYPFSERYGWVQDKYGLSWQLIFTNPEGEDRPSIIPSFLFVGDQCGKAEEASNFYISTFKNSKRGTIARYPASMPPDKEGTMMYTDFTLEHQWFTAMDSAHKHKFTFNEAVSLLVNCEDQTEIDYFWEKLSAVPKAEQCGWLQDRYGVSWQISSIELRDMLNHGTREQINRVTQAFLPMKKFDIANLKKAYINS